MRGCSAANAWQVFSGEDMLPPDRVLTIIGLYRPKDKAFFSQDKPSHFMRCDSFFGVIEPLTGEGLQCNQKNMRQVGMVSDPDPY